MSNVALAVGEFAERVHHAFIQSELKVLGW